MLKKAIDLISFTSIPPIPQLELTPAMQTTWKMIYTTEEIASYLDRKSEWVNMQMVSEDTLTVYTTAMDGLERLKNIVVANEPWSGKGEIEMLQDALRRAASQHAKEALMKISDRVLKVSTVIPSKEGVMMNGGQAIGYTRASAVIAAETEADMMQCRDFETTEYVEQLMRCVALNEDGTSYNWHAVSPGFGMTFLQSLDDPLKKYNFIANLFDCRECGCARFAPNLTKKEFTFEVAKIVVKSGVRVIEIEETPADNVEFECALIYCIKNGVEELLMDDGDKEDHPLWEYIHHPMIGNHIVAGKISGKCIGLIQMRMFKDVEEGKLLAIPTPWDEICTRMANFASVVMEGSDTMLFPLEGAPFVEHAALKIHFAMKKHLAEKMVAVHGEKARIGMQSFRQLEANEEIIPAYIPAGWSKGATNWGESAMPLCNVGAAMNLPRAAACGVQSKTAPSEAGDRSVM